MKIQKIDVVGSQFLQGSFDRQVQRLRIISDIQNLLIHRIIVRLQIGSVLIGGDVIVSLQWYKEGTNFGRNEQLISDPSFF